MTLAQTHIALAAAMRSEDPEAFLRGLGLAEGDGVRIAGLLVAKLRFERLVQGSAHAEAWFERDPAAFAAAFRRYHREVPPLAIFPVEEAASWRAWVGA